MKLKNFIINHYLHNIRILNNYGVYNKFNQILSNQLDFV
jgi:hypothetical protein